MKNTILVGFALVAFISAAESIHKENEMQAQEQKYEKLLEVQKLSYKDEIVMAKQERDAANQERDAAKEDLVIIYQELRNKQFEFDMATNRIEQLNKEAQ